MENVPLRGGGATLNGISHDLFPFFLGWAMGDTPWTVMATRAPAVLTMMLNDDIMH